MWSVSLTAQGTYVLVAVTGIIGTLNAVRLAILGVQRLRAVERGQGTAHTAEILTLPTRPTPFREAA